MQAEEENQLMPDSKTTGRLVESRYFVEECDLFSSTHLGHEILGWFDDLEKAKRFANEKAIGADSLNRYRVYEPRPDADVFGLTEKCVYEIKGTGNKA